MKTSPVIALAVLAGTLAASASTAMPQDDVAVVYARNCAMCHGASGAGDGAVAASLTVRPPDFTAEAWKESRTDDQITAAIRDGASGMPGFGQRMTAEQIAALVAYIREMGDEPDVR